MRKPPKWVSKQAVLAIHERLQAEHGGAPRLLDEGLLDAALASPRNHFAYERGDIPRLAAAYAYALTVAGVFMELNGFILEASEQDAAQATRALSSRRIDEVEFANLLRACSSKLRVARRRVPSKATTKRRARRGKE